jgi:hypothetical protein
MTSKCTLPSIQSLIGMKESFALEPEQQFKFPNHLIKNFPQRSDFELNESSSSSFIPSYLNGAINNLKPPSAFREARRRWLLEPGAVWGRCAHVVARGPQKIHRGRSNLRGATLDPLAMEAQIATLATFSTSSIIVR